MPGPSMHPGAAHQMMSAAQIKAAQHYGIYGKAPAAAAKAQSVDSNLAAQLKKKLDPSMLLQSPGQPAKDIPRNSAREKGTVHRYAPMSGWGFVRSPAFSGDLFFHRDNIMKEWQERGLEQGDEIEFTVVGDVRGRAHAVMVKPVVNRGPIHFLGERLRGVVRRLDERWGFINSHHFDGDLFLHRDNILHQKATITVGMECEFDIVVDNRGRAVGKWVALKLPATVVDWCDQGRIRGKIDSYGQDVIAIKSNKFIGRLLASIDSCQPGTKVQDLQPGAAVEFEVCKVQDMATGGVGVTGTNIAVLDHEQLSRRANLAQSLAQEILSNPKGTPSASSKSGSVVRRNPNDSMQSVSVSGSQSGSKWTGDQVVPIAPSLRPAGAARWQGAEKRTPIAGASSGLHQSVESKRTMEQIDIAHDRQMLAQQQQQAYAQAYATQAYAQAYAAQAYAAGTYPQQDIAAVTGRHAQLEHSYVPAAYYSAYSAVYPTAYDPQQLAYWHAHYGTGGSTEALECSSTYTTAMGVHTNASGSTAEASWYAHMGGTEAGVAEMNAHVGPLVMSHSESDGIVPNATTNVFKVTEAYECPPDFEESFNGGDVVVVKKWVKKFAQVCKLETDEQTDGFNLSLRSSYLPAHLLTRAWIVEAKGDGDGFLRGDLAVCSEDPALTEVGGSVRASLLNGVATRELLLPTESFELKEFGV